jgi:hypothetical protein
MQMKKYIIMGWLALSVTTYANAQIALQKTGMVDSTMKISVFFAPQFTYNFALADLKKDFGNNMSIGAVACLKLPKNWTFDIEFKYFFGGKVDTGLVNRTFKHLVTSNGFFVNGSGREVNEIELEFRGTNLSFMAGKVFPVSHRFRNSGIWIRLGLGVTQHYMNIKNPENTIPSLTNEYKKGYDHLTIAFTLNQFVGYLHFTQRKLWCFYGGVEFSELFAKRQREYDFTLMRKDNAKLFEAMVGLKVGWIIPLYRRTNTLEFEYR